MPKINLYLDCTNGVSGDRLSQCLKDLCNDKSFVEAQQQLVTEELHLEQLHTHNNHNHDGSEVEAHTHSHAYSHRSFQSLLTMLSGCELDDDVKAMTLKIYTILAIAEAEVHGETLETVHFHEVGRPQAIVNMVGIAAALVAINPDNVYCSKIFDGVGTVLCAHGEIPIPVPAVRAMMGKSKLNYGTKDVRMEMVTPTGLAALLAMEPIMIDASPALDLITETTEAFGERNALNEGMTGLKAIIFWG
jgi:pyridinium-3,5-bisthiocarboxylic acid mononucleotide nickel chelatase